MNDRLAFVASFVPSFSIREDLPRLRANHERRTEDPIEQLEIRHQRHDAILPRAERGAGAGRAALRQTLRSRAVGGSHSLDRVEITDADREILRDVLRQFLRAGTWPNAHKFKMDRFEQRQAINRLVDRRALISGGEFLELTLLGLLEAHDPEAAAEIDYASGLWPALHQAYKEGPTRPWEVEELVGAGTRVGLALEPGRIARALTFLQYLHEPRWMMVNKASPERIVQRIHLTEAVLDINAENWQQKFWELHYSKQEPQPPPPSLVPGALRSPPLIFISYSHADEHLAALLKVAIEAAGLTPFLAADGQRGLTGGEGWFADLIAKIRASVGLVYLATPSSIREDWPVFEVGGVYCAGHRALSLCIGVAPGDLPKPLQNIQAVVVGEPDDKVLHKLADAFGMPLDKWWRKSWEQFRAFLEPAREMNRRGKAANVADPAYRAWKHRMLTEIFGKGRKDRWVTIEHAVDHNERWALLADKELLFRTTQNGNRFEIGATGPLLARSDRLKTVDAEELLKSIEHQPLVEDEPLE